MNRVVLMIIPALINIARKGVKCFVILLIVAGFLSCDKQSSFVETEEEDTEEPQTFAVDEADDVEFCSCLDLENIYKTIPIVNKFLAGLPEDITKEEAFQSLATWLKSFSCNIDAKILYGTDLIWGSEQMYGVAISVKDNETIRELELDFAVIERGGNLEVTYSQIAGYLYYKQDAIHVATRLIKIDKVFDFINSLDFGVKEIQGGSYFSNMPSNTDNLQSIVNELKAKPYTNNSWVAGNMNGLNNQIVLYIRLYEMHNREYQEDWFKSMIDYQLVEDDFTNQLKDLGEDYIYGPGHIVVFYIPEEAGKHWEAKFKEYNFVRWTEMSYSRYVIR